HRRVLTRRTRRYDQFSTTKGAASANEPPLPPRCEEVRARDHFSPGGGGLFTHSPSGADGNVGMSSASSQPTSTSRACTIWRTGGLVWVGWQQIHDARVLQRAYVSGTR